MSQSIQVSFVQEGDVYTVHTGSSVLKDIVMDYTGVPETERGGNSSTLLIAAALSCFCGSIRAALVARGVPFRAIRAQGTGTKEPNADGAMRLVGIDIDVKPTPPRWTTARRSSKTVLLRRPFLKASTYRIASAGEGARHEADHHRGRPRRLHRRIRRRESRS